MLEADGEVEDGRGEVGRFFCHRASRWAGMPSASSRSWRLTIAMRQVFGSVTRAARASTMISSLPLGPQRVQGLGALVQRGRRANQGARRTRVPR